METESAIRADSLTKLYRSGGGSIRVFDQLSLVAYEGEQVAVVGESGAGKSTLLHLLGGLDRPTSGTVFYSSRQPSNGIISLSTLNELELADFRNRHLGFVWQTPSLLPEFTAIENVMMPLLIRGVASDDALPVARERLREVSLATRADHRAGELSGGEQQRVGLARALITRPKVLLADEPTGNLDQRTSESIFSLLREVHKSHALTSVFVTHNHSFAARCDRVLKLDKSGLRSFSIQQSFIELPASLSVTDATRLDGGTYV